MVGFREFLEGGVDKDGDGELGADHYASEENGERLQSFQHKRGPPSCFSMVSHILTEFNVLTDLSV
jgi:hypothetical protein